jgi:alpha-D-ribose 1-methylphosphonate 5-phosphate C-P lyase
MYTPWILIPSLQRIGYPKKSHNTLVMTQAPTPRTDTPNMLNQTILRTIRIYF